MTNKQLQHLNLRIDILYRHQSGDSTRGMATSYNMPHQRISAIIGAAKKNPKVVAAVAMRKELFDAKFKSSY